MNNVRETIWNKRVHPFFGLILLVLSIFSISWMSKNIISSNIKASGSSIPTNVSISNITNSSFTVSYTTSEAVIGSINYGKDGQVGSLALDVRDTSSGAPSSHFIHYFTISQLSPTSTYYFSIDSSGNSYLNNGSFYTVTTGPTISQSPQNSETVKGSVVLEGGGTPQEAIVTISSGTSQLLSSLVSTDGTYSIPLTGLRTQNLQSYQTLALNALLQETVEDQSTTSHVSLLAGQANPVPLITLSTNYDFSLNSSTLVAQSVSQGTSKLTGFPSIVNTIQVTTPILNVPTENEGFNDSQPQFSGKGIPNSQILITVQSTQEQSATVQTDQFGNWNWRPTLPLTPGQHTLTIQAPDVHGVMQTLQRMFTVYAQGSEFTSPSGPPAVLTATPVPPSPTVVTPTTTPQPSPSFSPTPSPTSLITPTIQTPITGSSDAVIGAVSMMLIAGVGGLLFFYL